MGRLFIVAGLALTALGLVLWLHPGKGRGGLLPGDLFIEKGDLKFYFPIVTCLAFSGLLTLLLWLIRK